MTHQVNVPNDGNTYVLLDENRCIIRVLPPGEVLLKSGQLITKAE